MIRLRLFLVAALSLFPGAPASSQDAPQVPFAAIHGVPMEASLPRLVAEGWQIVGVSLRDRTFAYHLVRQGSLVLCLSEVGALPPGTECMRLADGPAPSGPNDGRAGR